MVLNNGRPAWILSVRNRRNATASAARLAYRQPPKKIQKAYFFVNFDKLNAFPRPHRESLNPTYLFH
ncbi:hypothetical protein Y033_5052 [Burkholderia pseudomallei MSHR435]|nr:hypothetical protein DO63_5962 [Burkholderia pseudomallei]KGX79084.1 hypothetical protein Y033_5052 [Burkholderia pseudomallei MSHR435]